MSLLHPTTWEIAAGASLAAIVAVALVWWIRKHRPTADELERARRMHLARTGRLVDGMLLDVCEMQAEDGRTLTLLEYNYRIAGVEYSCAQDITTLREVLDPAQVRAGFPCSVRYVQSSPQNSIVIAETWSGLRDRFTVFPAPNLARPISSTRSS